MRSEGKCFPMRLLRMFMSFGSGLINFRQERMNYPHNRNQEISEARINLLLSNEILCFVGAPRPWVRQCLTPTMRNYLMTFLNPYVLFGLIAASFPVLFHLFAQRKARRVEFSSI